MHRTPRRTPQTLLPGGVTMGMLNRSAVVIKPLLPYLEWTKQDDDTGVAESVFETMRSAPHVYLLPECEDPESERDVLEDFWPQLFAAMLDCWLTDERCWPKDRTLRMFGEWFEIQMCSVVEDLDLDEELIELD